MAKTLMVLDLLRRTDRQLARTQRRYAHIRLWGALISAAIYAALLALACIQFIRAWHTREWAAFWVAAIPVLGSAVHSARFLTLSDSRAHLFAPVAALRQSAHAVKFAIVYRADAHYPSS